VKIRSALPEAFVVQQRQEMGRIRNGAEAFENTTDLEKTKVAGRRRGVVILCLLVAASLLAVGIPVWLIQPFRHQTPGDLALSYFLRRWSPVGVPILAGLALFWVIRLWRSSPGILRKTALALALPIPLFAAWFAQQNHFEWMFHPPAKTEYSPPAEATFLSEEDRVLGVEINGEAAAYPIRALAYHHLVHDRVGGVDLVATY
jgi:hypothetical protein